MIKNFNTLNDFFNAENKGVALNDFVQTFGYSAVNDGGCGLYIVKSISDSASDDITFEGLEVTCKGYTLELIPDNGTVRVEQFGAVGNYNLENMTTDEKTAFYVKNKDAVQAAIDSGILSVEFANKTYMVAGNIIVSDSVNIIGNSAVLQLGESYDAVIKLYKADGYVENVNIYDITLKGKDVDSDCALLWGENVGKINVDKVQFDTGSCAVSITTGYENSHEISIRNCNAINVITGFLFDNVIDFKINNCRIELADDEDSKGLYFARETSFGVVEDLSVYNAGYAVFYEGEGEPWDGLAIERILFKNLLVDECNYGVKSFCNQIPLHFSNAMFVNVNYGVHMELAKNIVFTNSSVLINSPSIAAVDAVPVCVRTYAQAKFTHVQFDFPWDFEDISTVDEVEPCELSYIDCTMQKTDLLGVQGVASPSGFGIIGDRNLLCVAQFTEIFDACEFRSCIQNHIIKNENEAVSGYNFPFEIYSVFENNSKLIIKNCRFVNETPCDVPCFVQRNSSTLGNFVVYNCFFENYVCTYPDDSSAFPILGKWINRVLSWDSSGLNIFAKCNIRSSAPDRENGTVINEMKTYE